MPLSILPPIRCRDRHGAGYFGASRGKRKHNGVDFHVEPGANICAFSPGTVTKLGYPYAKHLQFRYVEITDSRNYRCRYFYCAPAVDLGVSVDRGSVLGVSQNLGHLYQGIVPHVHFEVVTGYGEEKVYHDPMKYLAGDI